MRTDTETESEGVLKLIKTNNTTKRYAYKQNKQQQQYFRDDLTTDLLRGYIDYHDIPFAPRYHDGCSSSIFLNPFSLNSIIGIIIIPVSLFNCGCSCSLFFTMERIIVIIRSTVSIYPPLYCVVTDLFSSLVFLVLLLPPPTPTSTPTSSSVV